MSTNWLRTRLSQLLRQRHEVHKPTWITTNCRTLAELAAAIEPPPDPGERSPMERLVTVAEQHFLRVELPAYDQVRAQLESGELPSLPYCEAVVPAEEYRQQLEDLPARKWAAFEQRAELLPQTWLPLWSRLHPGEEPVATPRPNPLQELLHEMDEAEDAGDDGPSRRDTSGAVLGVSSIGWQPRSTPADDAGKTADVDDADDYGPDDDEDPKRKSKSKRKPKPKAKPAAKAQPPKRKPKQKTKANPGRSLRKPTRRQPPVD